MEKNSTRDENANSVSGAKIQQMLWLNLPPELWMEIFAHLLYFDLKQVRMVCRDWHSLTKSAFMKKSKLVITNDNIERLYRDLEIVTAANEANVNEAMIKTFTYATVEFHSIRPDDDKIDFILQKCGRHIQSAHLYNSPIFVSLQSWAPNVEYLHMKKMDVSSDMSQLQDINLRTFKKLRSIDLTCQLLQHEIKRICLCQLQSKKSALGLQRLCVDLIPNRRFQRLFMRVLTMHAKNLKILWLVIHDIDERDLTAWSEILPKLTNLQKLRLQGRCPKAWLTIVFRYLPRSAPLKYFDLSGLLLLSNDMLKEIANSWSSTIEILELMFCDMLTDDGIKELAVLKNNLRHLDLSYCQHVTGRGLIEGIVSEENQVLRSLSLNYLHQLAEVNLLALSERLPRLVSLKLESCSNAVSDLVLRKIFQRMTQLRTLVLDDCKILKDSSLLGGDCTAGGGLRSLRGLEILQLRSCHNLTNVTLQRALRLPNLRTLYLGYNCHFNKAGLSCLSRNVPLVENLYVTSCPKLTNQAVFVLVTSLPRLRRLNLSNNSNITDESIDFIIRHAKNIEEVHLYGIDAFEYRKNKIIKRFAESLPLVKVYI